MTQGTWAAVALALADLRSRLLERRHVARAQGVELAARTVCKTLRSKSARFNGQKFMRIVLRP